MALLARAPLFGARLGVARSLLRVGLFAASRRPSPQLRPRWAAHSASYPSRMPPAVRYGAAMHRSRLSTLLIDVPSDRVPDAAAFWSGGHLLCVIPLHSDPDTFRRLARVWD